MGNRYRKRCSTPLVIRKTKVKTTVKYYLTPIRITVIKKIRDNVLARLWREGTLVWC